jgi:DNA polymerase III gamma/tau subunit
MLRFLFPAMLLVGAMLLLIAGSLGDWDTWHGPLSALRPIAAVIPQRQPAAPAPANTVPASTAPAATATTPADAAPPAAAASQAAASQDAALAALQQQAAALQAEIAQRQKDLASLRSDTDQARRDLDTIKQQKQAETAAIAQRKLQERQAADARRQRAAEEAPAPPPVAATPAEQQKAAQPVPAAAPPVQLLRAREALAAGRPRQARHLLATAQTELVLQPSDPGQPAGAGGNFVASLVGEAIHSVDTGDTNRAFQAINQAIDMASQRAEDSGYVAPVPPAAGYSTQPFGNRIAGQP